MSKFTDAAATMYGLSVAGMEEASRLGLRDTDVDHLFLALVTSEQAAGQVLRGAGITLAAAREAVAAQHAEQLRALGVDHEPPAPGPIVFHETGGYEWTDRAQEVFKRSGSKGNDGGSIAVLRALLDEPSGLIEAVLSRLGVSGGELLARADAAERIPAFGGVSRPSRAPLSRSTTAFVPAPVGDVWELLADPRRMPEWDLMLGVVDVPGGAGRVPRALATYGVPVSPLTHPTGSRSSSAKGCSGRRLSYSPPTNASLFLGGCSIRATPGQTRAAQRSRLPRPRGVRSSASRSSGSRLPGGGPRHWRSGRSDC